MVDPKIIREWLGKAEEDFQYAVASLEDELPFYSQICFHFQHYIDTRYPVHWPTYHTKETTEQARKAVERIGSFVKQKLTR